MVPEAERASWRWFVDVVTVAMCLGLREVWGVGVVGFMYICVWIYIYTYFFVKLYYILLRQDIVGFKVFGLSSLQGFRLLTVCLRFCVLACGY